MSKIKTIGILTSGGDAPGMNAAIRAVTRAGIYNQFQIKGIYRGYDGLIKGEVQAFTTENVSALGRRTGKSSMELELRWGINHIISCGPIEMLPCKTQQGL